jgi:hypothetical protein
MHCADEYDTDKAEQRKGDCICQIVLVRPDHELRREWITKWMGAEMVTDGVSVRGEKSVVQLPFRKRNTMSNARIVSICHIMRLMSSRTNEPLTPTHLFRARANKRIYVMPFKSIHNLRVILVSPGQIYVRVHRNRLSAMSMNIRYAGLV